MSNRRLRLDAELVRRGLARSREHAVELVAAGRVRVSGRAATKPATQVVPAEPILVDSDPVEDGWASRGAYKLAGALDEFGRLPGGQALVVGRRCLDAGASTGGFTDVLLRRGASSVVAVDVGYGQLAWRLRVDPRVVVLERTNVRDLTGDQIGPPPGLVVADLSFISLELVLPPLAAVARADADLVVLVKPQFEVGRERIGPGGVVRDPALRAQAVRSVAAAARRLGLGVRAVTASQLPGPAGNVEYFLWLRRGPEQLDETQLAAAIARSPA